MQANDKRWLRGSFNSLGDRVEEIEAEGRKPPEAKT